MKTKTKTVSRKVYADISSRVASSLSMFPDSAAEAMRIVDAYLEGDKCASSSDMMAMIAFSMIKDELDRAMVRSARARERARVRKEKAATKAASLEVDSKAEAENGGVGGYDDSESVKGYWEECNIGPYARGRIWRRL